MRAHISLQPKSRAKLFKSRTATELEFVRMLTDPGVILEAGSPMKSNMQTQEPMTRGNMRMHGVRSLSVYCLGHERHHQTVLGVSGYPDHVPVPAFGPRMRCQRCGHLGADARPNGEIETQASDGS